MAALTCAVTLGGMVAPAGALPGHARPAGEAMAASRPAAPASSSTFASRSTAAPRPIVDSAGRTWEARTVGWGTWNRSDGLAGKAIAGVVDQMLYRANAWGIKWYRLDVPAAATYTVRLHMAEDHFSAAGKRVFDVVAEGRTVARDVDIFRAVGRAAAHVVEFSVPVTDGRLDVNFVARANNPLVSAVEVVSNVPVTQVKTGGLTNVPVSPKSFWRTSVRNAPLAVNSARTVAIIAKDAKDNWGGTAGFNTHHYNMPIYVAAPGQRKVRVEFNDCQRKGYLPNNLFTGFKQFLDVPVPPHAVPAVGTDGAMTIYDPGSDKVWEFWQMRRAPLGGWSACWGGRIDNVSTSQGIFAKPYGSTATGLMLGAGVVTAADIRRGRIEHVMPLAVITAARWDRYSWPANRSDGNSNHPDAVMEGQRLRLDPSLDVASLGLSPVGQMIARAAQEYGFVVVDKGGAVAVIAESGEPERARTGVNPWDLLLPESSHRAMRGFPWDRLQALPVNYGRP